MKLTPQAREIVSTIRRYRLTYDTLRAATKAARKETGLKRPTGGRKLPRLLSEEQVQEFFKAVATAGNIQHEIMLKLLFYTAVRVAELCSIKIADVDMAANKIFIDSGKGDKDRYILFPDTFRLVLQTYTRSVPENTYLFESRHRRHYSTRRIEQIVTDYRDASGIDARVHPHLFRHMMLTHLTKSGMSDSQIQLISGHASKQSLERYQHMALGDVQPDYQTALRKLGV